MLCEESSKKPDKHILTSGLVDPKHNHKPACPKASETTLTNIPATYILQRRILPHKPISILSCEAHANRQGKLPKCGRLPNVTTRQASETRSFTDTPVTAPPSTDTTPYPLQRSVYHPAHLQDTGESRPRRRIQNLLQALSLQPIPTLARKFHLHHAGIWPQAIHADQPPNPAKEHIQLKKHRSNNK